MLTKTWNFNHVRANPEAEPPRPRIASRQDLTSSTSKSHAYQRDPRTLAPALCRTATRTDKKEFGLDVGDALAYDFADTMAVTPPLFRILNRIGDCYDIYRHVPADCLPTEKARSPRVAPSVKTLMLYTCVLCSRTNLVARSPSCKFSPRHSRAMVTT